MPEKDTESIATNVRRKVILLSTIQDCQNILFVNQRKLSTRTYSQWRVLKDEDARKEEITIMLAYLKRTT